MKTYILRPFKTVEPQSRRAHNPPTVRPIVKHEHTHALFIGLDVHNDSIAVCLAASDSTELRPYGVIGGRHDDVLRLLKKLSAAHPPVAGFAGHPQVTILGTDTFTSAVGASSFIP